MSIELDKLMNLADGKVLYDDLRDRLKQATVIASEADILAIINDYGKQDEVEEETFVVEMEFEPAEGKEPGVIVGGFFKSVNHYTEIVDAYLSGKSVVFHLPADDTLNSQEAVVSMIGYYSIYDTGAEEMYKPSPINISASPMVGDGLAVDGWGVMSGKFVVVVTVEQEQQGGGWV